MIVLAARLAIWNQPRLDFGLDLQATSHRLAVVVAATNQSSFDAARDLDTARQCLIVVEVASRYAIRDQASFDVGLDFQVTSHGLIVVVLAARFVEPGFNTALDLQ